VQAAVEDSEWYLLARLAAQRAASYCGSVPLVLDDALSRLDPASTREILDRLERMAATVQLVVVTEDLPAAAWASQLGAERAAVVELS
jgi:ABC-type phosphate transport system ATPase subunit